MYLHGVHRSSVEYIARGKRSRLVNVRGYFLIFWWSHGVNVDNVGMPVSPLRLSPFCQNHFLAQWRKQVWMWMPMHGWLVWNLGNTDFRKYPLSLPYMLHSDGLKFESGITITEWSACEVVNSFYMLFIFVQKGWFDLHFFFKEVRVQWGH